MQNDLEKFKKEVEKSLIVNNNCSIAEAKRLMNLYEEDFPELLREFSKPEVASLAMIMGY